MDKLRLLFEKTDRAVYISHLDLMHTMQRAFNRAGLQLKYSEGFNPHPQISIALPMSLGHHSHCEIMDFKLREDAEPTVIQERLNPVLPEGIRVLKCYIPERKASEIKWLQISGCFEYDTRPAEDMAKQLTAFYDRAEIVIEKKTKRGMGQSDIKPSVKSISFTADGGAVSLDAVISAQEPTLNPELLAEALRQLQPEIAPDFAKFFRQEVFDANMEIFR